MEVAVDKPQVHILQWFHMAWHSEVLTCLWLWSVGRLKLVRLVNKCDHQHWISKVSSACQNNSFARIGLLGDLLVWFSLCPHPRPLIRVRKICALQSVTNSKEFDTVDHTGPRMVPSSDWPDSCCYKKTQPRINICPSACHNGWHMLEAYPQEFDSPFRSVRQSVDGKLSFELI